MRVTLDTNVLLSIAAFHSKNMRLMLAWICQEHQLVLSSYVVGECYEVVRRKKPSLVSSLDRFFAALPFELEHTPQTLPKHNLFIIRDCDDEKVLYSAITADADILITGDKDFFDILIEKPIILTPRQFMEKYMLM
ncbi:MAG: putative toxin-antitoxin system toxin component, PIN family [Clostridia bacterium]